MAIMQSHKSCSEKYPAYKDSRVEWLGEIPTEWTLGKLGTLLKPISIKGHPDLPLLSITRELGVIERNLDEDEGNHNFIPDDLSGYKVILEGQFGMNKMKAWQGSYGISRFTGIVSPAYYVFDFTSEIDPRFFHFAIRSKNYVAFFGRASDGVRIGQWDLSKSRMKEIPFFIPSPPEQTAIANFLDDKTAKIDRAIAQKEQLIALLKERKQIIIQDLVTGKKVWNKEKKAWTEPVEVKDSGIKSVGEIPSHWETKKLKFILDSQGRIGFKGYTTSDLVDKGDGALTLGASHMDWDGNLKLRHPVFIRWKKYYESPEIMASKGDILIVQRGSTCGKVALINVDLGPTTINPSLVLLKKIKENPNFVFEGIKVVLDEILNIVSKTAIPMLSQFQIDNIAIPVPPKSEQFEIVGQIETQSAQIDQAVALQQTQISTLKEYKATLIDSAVTGKLRVPSVQEIKVS